MRTLKESLMEQIERVLKMYDRLPLDGLSESEEDAHIADFSEYAFSAVAAM